MYVQLRDGARVPPQELAEHARVHIHERAAIPKHIEILPELPRTAVGKIFKPDLRKLAIRRVYDQALASTGVAAEVADVVEDRKLGLVARIRRTGAVGDDDVNRALGAFTRPWQWVD